MKTRKKLEFSAELIQQSVHDDADHRDSIFKHKKGFFLRKWKLIRDKEREIQAMMVNVDTNRER